MMAGEDLAIAVYWAQIMTLIAFILMCTTVVFGAMMGLMAKWTPAPTFLKAKLRGQNILMAIRRDRKADFTLGTYSSGLIDTKKYGHYITDPNSVMNENKSGVRLFMASTELGATISPEIARVIQAFQDEKIPNIRIAKMIDRQLHFCRTCNKDIMADYKQMKNDATGAVVDWFECSECHGKDIEKKDLAALGLDVDTLRMTDLSKWSETIMNPILQKANVENKVEERMMDEKKPKLGLLMTLVGIGMLFFFVCLGVYILLPSLTHAAAPAAAAVTNPITDIVNATSGGVMRG